MQFWLMKSWLWKPEVSICREEFDCVFFYLMGMLVFHCIRSLVSCDPEIKLDLFLFWPVLCFLLVNKSLQVAGHTLKFCWFSFGCCLSSFKHFNLYPHPNLSSSERIRNRTPLYRYETSAFQSQDFITQDCIKEEYKSKQEAMDVRPFRHHAGSLRRSVLRWRR